MVSPDLPSTQSPEIWALGPLPPPVTGMALLTEKVVQGLERLGPVKVFDLAWQDARPRFHTRAIRMLRAGMGLVRVALHGRVKNARLYIAANSEGGLLATGLTIMVARKLGYSIYLHHHTYNYIDHHNAKMAWIDRTMSAGDVHIMHCTGMIDAFRSRYASRAAFEILYPSIVSIPLAEPRSKASQPFRLGMLANLILSKGVDLAIDTFRELTKRHRDVRLSLAGPFVTAEAERLVKQTVREFGGQVSYLGPVYDEHKLDFFRSIDCFLFPSRNESWGIVLNEAMAAGLPVIAADRGCIRTLVGSRAGIVVSDEANYVSEAVTQVENWIDSQDRYQAASIAAIEQADMLQRTAASQLDELVNRIWSSAKS